MGRSLAGVAGFEPTNAGIKIRCLNHLATPQYNKWGGLRESNSRPPGPQSGALTNWATPAIYGAPEEIRTPDTRLRRPLLYPTELQAHILLWCAGRYPLCFGAGDGNRTHATSLEGWSSTIELHPHETRMNSTLVYYNNASVECQTFLSIILQFFQDFFFYFRFPSYHII